jgi:hypothetical protein
MVVDGAEQNHPWGAFRAAVQRLADKPALTPAGAEWAPRRVPREAHHGEARQQAKPASTFSRGTRKVIMRLMAATEFKATLIKPEQIVEAVCSAPPA